jgi:phage head maturation protease
MRKRLVEQDYYGASEDAQVKRIAGVYELKSVEESERAVERYISTRDVDRDREILDPDGAILDEYMLSPVVLWAHDYTQPPIGRAEWVKSDGYGLLSRTVYATTPRADEVWQLIRSGFLRTASVGFLPVKRVFRNDPEWAATVAAYSEKWGTDVEAAGAEVITTRWVLLEYSDVPVPANPYALVVAIAKGEVGISNDMLDALGIPDPRSTTAGDDNQWTPDAAGEHCGLHGGECRKGAIPYRREPLADEDTEWDAAEEVRGATPEQLRRMCAWYDETKPDNVTSYKFPHHRRRDYATVWRAVANAMARLPQSDIPAEDIPGVRRHLEGHYRDFGKPIPGESSAPLVMRRSRIAPVIMRRVESPAMTSDDLTREVIHALKGRV